MLGQIVHTKTEILNKRQNINGKHSSSFILSVMLLLYVILYAYIQAFIVNVEISYYVPIIMLILIFLYLFYKLYFYNSNILDGNSGVFIIILAYAAIWYLAIFSGLERLLYLLIFLMSLLLFKRYPLYAKERKKLYYLFLVTVFILLLNGSTLDTMNENKLNPNRCGLFLMLLFCISIVRFAYKKSYFSLLISVISFFAQFIFLSRSTIIGCVLFFVLFLLSRAWKKTIKCRTAFWLIIIVSVLGILAAYVYSIVLYENIGSGQIVIFGKDLFTGRQAIWRYTLESVKEHFWFGVGSKLNAYYAEITGNAAFLSAHNQSLGVLASFGIVIFLLFYYLFAQIVSEKKEKQRVSRAPIAFILMITIVNYFETNFFYYSVFAIIVVYGLISSYSTIKKKRRVIA